MYTLSVSVLRIGLALAEVTEDADAGVVLGRVNVPQNPGPTAGVLFLLLFG